jgi:hypothetical protein
MLWRFSAGRNHRPNFRETIGRPARFLQGNRKGRKLMKKLLFATAAAAALFATVPANAQVYLGADPGGVGVQVGPVGVGVGDWRYRHGWRDAYGYGDCRMVRERVVTPSGRVIFRSHRTCY